MSNTNPLLAKHLADHPDRKDQDWASLFGVSRSHFSMIRSGKAAPSKKVMARMEAMTGGAVPILSWFAAPATESEKRRAS